MLSQQVVLQLDIKSFDIAKAGKGKGAVGVTVTNAAKNYVVLLDLDGYSEVSYNGSVVVP